MVAVAQRRVRHQPARLRRRDRRHRPGRDRDRRRPRRPGRRLRRDRSARVRGRRLRRPARPPVRLLGAPDVRALPQRARDAALPQAPREQGPVARAQHDPAGLVHDEAQRDGRDDAGHVPRLGPPPPVRARGRHRGLRGDRRHAGRVAGRDHRLRRRLAPAQLGRDGRVHGPAHDPRLPPVARRRPADGLPDPDLGARHQPGLGRHGRHGRRRRPGHRRRRGGRRRPPGQGREARRPAGGADDHLPQHARRLRAGRSGRSPTSSTSRAGWSTWTAPT